MAALVRRGEAAFPAAIVATIVLALLPTRWLAPWTPDVNAIVRFPLLPLGDGMVRLGGLIREPEQAVQHGVDAASGSATDPEAQETIRRLGEQAARLEADLRREQLRADELQAQLEQLQRIPADVLALSGPPIAARTAVTSRSLVGSNGVIELRAPSEARGRISTSTIAVADSVHLLGRVSDVAGMRVLLTPIANEATGLLRGAVVRPGESGRPMTAVPRVQLEPMGDGTLAGDVARSAGVKAGDEVIVDDPGWPEWAQGLVVGVVESVQTNDLQPLRERVTVRPRRAAHEVTWVTLLAGAEGGKP